MPFRRSILERERLLRESGEGRRGRSNFISFHSSGSTSRQSRKLKNPWFPGSTLFSATCFGNRKRVFEYLVQSPGPTRQLYWDEKAADRLELLPSSSGDSTHQDPLSLYGQYRSTLVSHMDVEKASHLDELETSLFHFYLPSSYLSFVCSRKK
jgi:hypothetical protein|uniref:Ribosomal protein subunit L10 n=1 Tax=Erodium gruinum TaxID=337380 RepID=A0A7U3SUU4_9ROSI|nr:ribosomal protein subunit L10 [Erodium gruinum]